MQNPGSRDVLEYQLQLIFLISHQIITPNHHTAHQASDQHEYEIQKIDITWSKKINNKKLKR